MDSDYIYVHLDPTHQRANGNLKYFEYQLAKQKKVETEEEEEEEAEGRQRKGRPDDYLPERRKYEQLCRGEGLRMVRREKHFNTAVRQHLSHPARLLCQTPRRQSRLFCRYYDNNRHPKYVIGPVKQEDEWDRPRIVRYHDIVSDKEMEKVKELAKPRVSPRVKTQVTCGGLDHLLLMVSHLIGSWWRQRATKCSNVPKEAVRKKIWL